MSDNAIRVFELHLDHVSEKDSQDGKLLTAAFIKGPSTATRINGDKVIVKAVDKFKNYDDSKNSDSKSTTNDKDNSNSSNKQANDKENSNSNSDNKLTNNESYSIFEAYLDLFPIFERDADKSKSKHVKKSNSKSAKKVNKHISNMKADSNNTDASNTEDDDIDASVDAAFKEFGKLQDKAKADAKAKEDADITKKEDSDYNKAYVRVGIKDQGYTEWELWIDKTVGKNRVNLAMTAIQKCKFEYAYNLINSNKTNLIVKSVATYLYKDRKDNVPPFIGYCRYAIDSGSEEGIEESVTICLAVAPVNISTGKAHGPNSVLKSVYNVNVTDLTDNIFSELLTGISSTLSNKNMSNSDNKYANDKIHKFLHKKFKCIGDERFYGEYEKIVKFIRKQIADGHLKFDEKQSVIVSNEYALNTKKSLILF